MRKMKAVKCSCTPGQSYASVLRMSSSAVEKTARGSGAARRYRVLLNRKFSDAALPRRGGGLEAGGFFTEVLSDHGLARRECNRVLMCKLRRNAAVVQGQNRRGAQRAVVDAQ